MTTEPMPKRAAGVTPRPGSSILQLRIMVPGDLRHLYPKREAYRQSLGTSDVREANRIAAGRWAEWLQKFEEQRRALNPQTVERITPEMVDLLAARVSALLLMADETTRHNPKAAQALLGALHGAREQALVPLRISKSPSPLPAAFSAPADPWAGLSPELLDEMRQFNGNMDEHAATLWATQRISAVLPLVQAEALKLGVHFDKTTPGALEVMRKCLTAYRQAWQGIVKRDAGEVVETPKTPDP